jgi:hypothetical protein
MICAVGFGLPGNQMAEDGILIFLPVEKEDKLQDW